MALCALRATDVPALHQSPVSQEYKNICLLWLMALMVSVGNSEDPDVVLLKNEHDLYCAAKGNASHSAISWIGPVEKEWEEPQSMPKVNCSLDWSCELGRKDCCKYWVGTLWKPVSSWDYDAPYLTDYRWESLQQNITVKETMKLSSLQSGSWNIPLSVRAECNAHILLCNEDKNKCIVIRGLNNKQSENIKINEKTFTEFSTSCSNQKMNSISIMRNYFLSALDIFRDTRKAAKKNTIIGNVEEGQFLNQWLHYKIQWIEDLKELRLTKFGESKPFKTQRMKAMNLTTIYGCTKCSGMWKLHKYKFWHSDEENAILESQLGYFGPGRICLSVQYYMSSESDLTFHLYIGDTLESQSLENHTLVGDGHWHEVHLKSQIGRNSKVSFAIKTHTSTDVGIGNIRQCNPDGETRISQWKGSPKKNLPACRLLQYQDQILESKSPESFGNITDCEEGFFMNDCSENCTTITRTHNCESYEICLPKGGCFCSPGYEGSSCNDKCKDGFYGWGCSKKCGNCKYGCNKKNGQCLNGCQSGYRPPYCRTKYPTLNDEPKIISKTSTSLTFQIDISNYKGDENLTFFTLQYRKGGDGDKKWTKMEQEVLQDSKIYEISIDQLEPYTEYEVRVMLTDENDLPDFEVPFVTERTDCVEPPFAIYPGQSNVTLLYMMNDKNHGNCSYKIHGVNKNDTLQNKTVHEDLDPYKNYTVTICCSMQKWKCVSCSNKSFTTHEAASSEPLSLKAHDHEHQVTLTWELPEKANGKLMFFEVELMVTYTYLVNIDLYKDVNRTLDFPVSDQEKYNVSFSDLLPSTNYTVMVRAVSSVKGNKTHTYFSLHTRQPNFTEPIIVEDKKITAHTVTIRLPPAPLYMTNQSVSFVVVTLLDGNMPTIENSIIYKPDLESYIMKPKDFHKGKRAWIAAEIQLKSFSESFVVGETEQSTRNDYGRNYNNHPLSPGSRYQISVVAVNFEDNKILSQYISLTDPVETKGTRNNGFLALLLLLLIPVLILLYKRYYKEKVQSSETDAIPLHQSNKGQLKYKIEIHDVKVKPRMPLPDTELLPEEERGLELGTNDATIAQPLAQQLSHRVKITNLEQYVNSAVMSGELQRQHSLFPQGLTQPCEYGQLPQNKPKNRYGNLIAYDATRVVLRKLPDDEFSDYINANYIEGYKSQKFYIATQGPKSNTIVDFWRMVWQENVHVICMLANIVENGKMKCEQYWPELGKEITHGTVTILNTSAQIFADYTFRCLHVSHEGRKRIIQHLHFTSWPDHGVPFYPQSVASYVKKILVSHKGVGPILVHCSAGVGRTGTIILADINLRMAATESAVDVLYYQQRIRQQRPNLVDNIDQYKLVHFILLECLVEEDSNIPCEGNFKSRIQELRTNGITVRQFQRLRKYNSIQEPQTTEMRELQRLSQRAVHKNRTQNIVPESRSQIYLTQAVLDDPTSAYINAVSVDGFRTKNQFISTQFPLTETVGDFWRMILEKRITLVIILNEIDLRDKSVVEFLPPDEKGIYPLPVIEVKQTKMTEHDHWILHHLQISDISLKGNARQEPVHVLKFKKWHSRESLPPSPNSLLMLWREAERLYSGTGPILVTCHDGAKACGLFLALTFLVEKVKLEQICDVRQAVQTVCQSRRQFISTQDQFEFLYDAIISYLEGFEIYSNFQ